MAETTGPECCDRVFNNDDLLRFAQRVLREVGMPERDAALMIDHLLWAERRGIPWLGLRKLIQYTARVRSGGTRVDAEPVTLASRGASVLIDARDGFGQIAGYHAMHAAIDKAHNSGVGICAVRNTTSAGALGYFALLAAEHDMIGLAINNSPPLQPAWGGRERVVGNQAFAIASPARRHPPLLLDIATSAVTLARIYEYQARGEALPEGLALGPDGEPTVDPAAALSGILLPMGGHRGFGLALMWEVLTGVLAGGQRYLTDVTAPDEHDTAQAVSMFLLAIDPTTMMPRSAFTDRIDDMIDRVHASVPASGATRVTVPGERGWAREQRAMIEGIPVPEAVVDALVALSRELGVPAHPFL